MANKIIGNTEYKAIRDKAYINGTQENVMQLAAELDKAGINYSGRVSEYRSAITVEAADRAKALEIMNRILYAAKEKASAESTEKNIIGNTEYRYIANKRYVKGETEIMLRIADRLAAENISFSGRISGDTATVTVSGDETQELVKKYFAEEKNRSENIQSAYFLALSSDTFEDGYYISEVNTTTGEEIAPYRSSIGDIPMFLSVEEALKSAESEGIALSNSAEQLDNWRNVEAEKERQSALARSRELIRQLPETEKGFDEYFALRENAADWVYFNPDGADGEGEFIVTALYAEDLLNAYNARSSTADYEKQGQDSFIGVIENGKQTVISADTREFERYALSCINSRNKENVIVSAPVVSGNGYDENFENIIERLENHFDDVKKHKDRELADSYADITDRITDKQNEITAFITNENFTAAEAALSELKELLGEAEKIKTEIQSKEITLDDVNALRSIQPARKSVQNMLENEVAKTPKFEKLLGDEMGKKSAFEMRNSDNEWRNDESKTAVVVNVPKAPYSARPQDVKKRNDIPRGTFTNRDTGLEIIFGRRSVEETITNAIYDDKRHLPVEARMSALYQMKDIIENAVCFDSQLSEPSSSRKSGNTLFIHRMYGLFTYDNEQYLANLAIEESYATDRDNKFRGTQNRVYNVDNIKITPVKLWDFQSHADLQNADQDTSQGVTTITIPQLYNLVKTYDQNFFENPNAEGRLDREAEIEAQQEFSKAMEVLAEKEKDKNLEFTVITFEDSSFYIEAGRIDDSNIKDTAAYADMMKNNFDINNIEDLDESIGVEYAVFYTGDGEPVLPTDKELDEIRNSLDDFKEKSEFVSSEKSSLYPWKNDDDILYELDMHWRERSDFDNIFEYVLDRNMNIVPDKNLSPVAFTADGVRHYNTISAVTQIKLKGSDWLDTVDAAVEMNRRGINFDDVELLRTTLAFDNGNYLQKDITPEQFAFYRKKIDDDPRAYENIILNHRKFKAEKEKDFAQARDDLQNNLAKVLYYSVASDELEDISEKIFTDDTDKKIEIAKEYLDSNFTYGKYTDILIQKSDNDVCFALASGFTKSGFEITYNWTEIAAAYEQAALEDMEWYYTSGRVSEVYKQALEKDTAVGSDLDVQLDKTVFTEWVSDMIRRQNSVKTAYEANDRALFESTVRKEVDSYFYMLCDKDESIGGYDLKNISDFVNAFCNDKNLRKEIYTAVTENVDISLGVIEKAREAAHNAGLPFSEKFADLDEEINPYVLDGTMSPEDYELTHKLMREDSVTFKDEDFPLDTTAEQLAGRFTESHEGKITPEERAAKADVPKYTIYQIKKGEDYHNTRFTNWNDLKRFDIPFDKNNYDFVYSGNVSDVSKNHSNGVILEDIFKKFNTDHPEDFKGHSLSVSDVITLEDKNGKSAFFVDSYGMTDVTDLFFDMEKQKIDLSKLSEITLKEEYDRRKDKPDDFLHIKNTITFSNLNSSYLIGRYKEFTYEYDDMPDLDEGDTFTTKQAMLDEVREFLEDMRKDHSKSISITDTDGKTTTLEGLFYEFEATEDRLAFMLPGVGYAEMFERDDDSYDYTFYDKNFKVVDSGVYDDVSITIRQAFANVLEDAGFDIGKCEPMDFEKLHDRVKEKAEQSRATDIQTEINELTAEENRAAVDKIEVGAKFSENTQGKIKPIYGKTREEAIEAGEQELYFDDRQENRDCISAIERSISENNDGSHFNGNKAITDLLSEYSVDRIALVIAARVSDAGKWDRRFSRENVEWAEKTLQAFDTEQSAAISRTRFTSHSVLLNDVADELRKNYEMFRSMQNKIAAEEKNADKMPSSQTETNETAVHNAFQKLKENHDFSPEVLKLLDRAEKHIIGNDLDNFNSKIFEVPLFQQTYGSVSRVNEKLFGGDLRSVIDEVNGYIFDEKNAEMNSTDIEARHEQMSLFGSSPRRVSSDEIPRDRIDETKEAADVPAEDIKLKTVVIDLTPKEEYNREQPKEKKTEKENNDFTGYVISEDDFGEAGGAKSRYAANIEAIKTLKAIEAENRTADPEEQSVLAGYTGWGAIPQVFDGNNDKWKDEFAELKELLTPEEYAAARKSTMNAHYTSPTVISAIYDGLKNLGFDGGKILEPAMGIGNFFGVCPENIRSNSELYGVELDSITGRIAQQLYPNADVQIKGFEKTNFPDNSFDVALSNVPFGDYKLNDRRYNDNNFLIHDYFFAKALDKAHPGGIVAFVTSKGTLDKENDSVRKYIAQRAELLGAIRLPNNAFKANAGTEVTSDIIFLQKRERPIEIDPDSIEWLKKSETQDGLSVNNYFVQHPEMVLGKIVEGNKLYGNQTNETSCIPIEGADLKQQLAEAIKNISGEYRSAEKEISLQNADEIPAPANSRKYSLYAVDGNLYFREAEDTMKKVNVSGDTLSRGVGLVYLRDRVRELLDLQLNNSDGSLDNEIAECRSELNGAYDSFVGKYGNVSDPRNAKAMQGDDGYNIVAALETKDENGQVTGKADIFTHNTVKPKAAVTHVDSAEEALILSVAEKAKVDFEYMTELCGMDRDTLISELDGQIYRLPQKEEKYVTADEYLTGNIRKKLRELEFAPDDMDISKNRKALEEAMPPRVEAKDISVKLGAHWVDTKYIADFIKDKFQPDYKTRDKMEVLYSSVSGIWKVEGVAPTAKNNYMSTQNYGTKRMNAYQILEGILNNSSLQVKDRVQDEYGNDMKDANGKYVLVVNDEETKAVRHCANLIKSEFADWIFADPDRREALVQKYNEVYNSIRHREYDGSHLNFFGMNTEITLKEHQKNAVARALYGGNCLLAHAVGAGKTYEMIAIAMEGKRLGLHNKCLFAVPNALTEQMGNDFRKLYPNANILVATQKDFDKDNRQRLFGKIAANDWDAVIVGHSQFDRMGLSAEREKEYLTSEINKLRTELEMAAAENNGKGFTVKQIEKSLASYEDKLSKMNDAQKKDDFIDFEQLGFDKVFVDESHTYKNLATATKMHNVSGLGSQGSARAFNLLMKSKYLDELTGSRGLTFASGTPISNSMTELYTLMRYLQSDMLKDLDINHFDEWAADFGEVKTDYELKPESDGKYQLKTRFAKFTNLPELMGIFKEAADIRTADTLNLEKPKANVTEVVAEPSKIQKRAIKELGKRAAEIRTGGVDPREDNMLKITSDGRKIGLDQRLLDPTLPDDPNSKVNLCVKNVFDIYTKTADKKSTQCIFCDMSTPKTESRQNRFAIYRPDETKSTGYDVVRKRNGISQKTDFAAVKTYISKNSQEEIDKLRDGDIAVIRRPNDDRTKIISEAAIFENGKFDTSRSDELLEKLEMSHIEDMPPKEFNIYDDIKNKLMKQGVPEKEIAFIHDYDTAEKKQGLFNKMNAGEVRVLLGSTSKCGAGMNAQKKMIALHHLDAPMRPSDMEQRNGRIERQGNENKEVDIFRYVTDKTFDAYLYQMLENKQKFISQVMTSKTPERTCADIDEAALDYAEVKALCAGNSLIKEEMELQTTIKDLKMEKARYNEKIYDLQDSIKVKIPSEIQYLEASIKHNRADLETARSQPKVTNDEGKESYPIKIEDKVYSDRTSGGEALKAVIGANIGSLAEGKTITVGEYRGLKLSVMYDTLSKGVKACLEGEKRHYCDLNTQTTGGNLIRLDNCINNIEKNIEELQEKTNTLKVELEQMKVDVQKPFSKSEELFKAETRLEEVHEELTKFELTDDTMNKEIFERLAESFPEIISGKCDAMKFEAGKSFDTLSVEMHGTELSIAHTYEQNGDLMYDPLIYFEVDYDNEKVIPISYENSGLGIYETYDTETEPTPASVQKMNNILDFTDNWLDNIEEQGYKPVEAEEKEKDHSFER